MPSPKSLLRRAIVAYSIRNRRDKADLISRFITYTGSKTVILVGAVGSASQANESIIERAIGNYATVVSAMDIVPADTEWPFVVGDGRALPYRDGAADLLIANAVIEHVGNESDQQKFVSEHCRVGRRWVITTPNRWFPVESHTSTVLRHWSPKWRARRSEFTRLLSLREFRALLPTDAQVVGRPWSPTFTAFSA